MNRFWFVQPGNWWHVADPVAWCLENARQPLLEPTRDRLLVLDSLVDRERIINVVLRRCNLNLVEIRSSERVVVHYWTDLADLRPLFKELRLARSEVQVAHLRHKTGTIVVQPGDNFLYGGRWYGFRWAQYHEKWNRCAEDETDDWTPAVISNYSWAGLPERLIPWAVLKAIWRREDAPLCPNCDVLLVVTAFRLNKHLLSANDSYLDRVCFSCRRWFLEWCYGSPWSWLVQHLEPALLPVRHHGIITRDLCPLHTEDKLQEARERQIQWVRLDKRTWEP